MEIDFSEAIEHVIEGEKITRLEWDDQQIFGYVKDGVLTLHKSDGDHQWIVSQGDLEGLDWVAITE